jgi:CcmD family protein
VNALVVMAAGTAAAGVNTIPKFPYLLAAYGVIFLLIFIYLVTINVRQSKLEREISALERRISGPS